jgi:alkylation response protein AidB-like acyl-CoA dehydrogenase
VNFDLSEEQRLLVQGVDQLLAREASPARVRAAVDSPAPFDAGLWRALLQLGAPALHLPEAAGGSGLELLDLALVAERLGWAAAPVPFLGHALAGLAIALGGSDAQQRQWLPALASGELLGSVALAEDGDTWQPEQWSLPVAERLHGLKRDVPSGEAADLLVVGLAGGALGVVEARAGGVRAEPLECLDRTRRLDHLRFEGAACAPLARGAQVAPRLRDAALVLLAADAFGGAARCLELAVGYAQTREQFGTTIAHFQAIKHQLANLALEVEPARALYWYAAHAWDHIPSESAVSAALAKAHLGEVFLRTARDAVEVHGGIGYTWDCDIHFWLRRAVFDRTFLGDPAAHRARVAQLSGWTPRARTAPAPRAG